MFNLKDKNIITIDVWVFILTLYLFIIKAPNVTLSDTTLNLDNDNLLVFSFLSQLILFILSIIVIIIFIKFCTKLRKYRYLDLYITCKKMNNFTTPFMIKVMICTLCISIITGVYIMIQTHFNWYMFATVALPYSLLMVIVIVLVSVQFNISKDLFNKIKEE